MHPFFKYIKQMVVLSFLLASPMGCAETPQEENESLSEEELTALYGSSSVDYTKTTHVFLVGDSSHLGTEPLESALGRLYRYKELYPQDQLVLYMSNGITAEKAKSFGATVISSDMGRVRASVLVRLLQKYKRIASIDFFGHSSPFGLGLEPEGSDRRLTNTTPGILYLKNSFAKDRDPYMTLNGCNGGIFLAPVLAKILQIPVVGAIGGTDFERLHEDGHWYPEVDNLYPSKNWASVNNQSFFSSRECSTGACVRMRPANSEYHGVWGDFEAALNHFKFFCPTTMTEETCSRAMARSLLSVPSKNALSLDSSLESYTENVIDFLCPTGRYSYTFDDCAQSLPLAAETGGTYAPGLGGSSPIECSMTSCEATIQCAKDANGSPIKGTCVVRSTNASASTHTMPLEYRLYHQGFESLQANH